MDLHGLSVEEALEKVELTIKTMVKSNLQTLRIIHGAAHRNHNCPIKTAVHKNLMGKWKKFVKEKKFEFHNEGSTLVIINLNPSNKK